MDENKSVLADLFGLGDVNKTFKQAGTTLALVQVAQLIIIAGVAYIIWKKG